MRARQWSVVLLGFLTLAVALLPSFLRTRTRNEVEETFTLSNRVSSWDGPAVEFVSAPDAAASHIVPLDSTAENVGESVQIDLHPPLIALLETDAVNPAKPIPVPRDLHPPEVVAAAESQVVEGPSLPRREGETRTAEREVPEKLPAPETSAPIGRQQTPPDSIDEIILKAMPNATEEERKIWKDEMRGMSAATVRDLLHLRRDLQNSPTTDEDLPGAAPRLGSRPDRIPAPQWPRRLPSSEEREPGVEFESDLPPFPDSDGSAILESSFAAVAKARTAILQNIANARTPGYRRLVLQAMELRASEEPDPGSEDVETRTPLGAATFDDQIDPRQGPIVPTGRSLDVAVDGPGFLTVQVQDETRFTRCGRLTLDGNRRLCVRLGRIVAPLVPTLQLPEDAAAVRIAPAGDVEVQCGSGQEWKSAGKIEICRFLNAEELRPFGASLYSETMASGSPQSGSPATEGYGSLRAGALEGSNVRIADEKKQLEELNEWMESLLGAAGPSSGTSLQATQELPPLTPGRRTTAVSAELPTPVAAPAP